MLALMIAGAALAGVPRAQAQQAAEPNTKITLDLKEVLFRTAIEGLFEKTGLQYAVETVTPNTPVTLSVRDVDFTTALRTLTRLAGATYRKENSIFVIGPRTVQQAPAAEPVADNVALEARAAQARGGQTWEKIPILPQISVAVIAYALGAQVLPVRISSSAAASAVRAAMAVTAGAAMAASVSTVSAAMAAWVATAA